MITSFFKGCKQRCGLVTLMYLQIRVDFEKGVRLDGPNIVHIGADNATQLDFTQFLQLICKKKVMMKLFEK